jgi:hypothetical protein
MNALAPSRRASATRPPEQFHGEIALEPVSSSTWGLMMRGAFRRKTRFSVRSRRFCRRAALAGGVGSRSKLVLIPIPDKNCLNCIRNWNRLARAGAKTVGFARSRRALPACGSPHTMEHGMWNPNETGCVVRVYGCGALRRGGNVASARRLEQPGFVSGPARSASFFGAAGCPG